MTTVKTKTVKEEIDKTHAEWNKKLNQWEMWIKESLHGVSNLKTHNYVEN